MSNETTREPVAGAASGSAPVVGGKYMMRHKRFGVACVVVTRIDDEWADVEVRSGTLRGMTDEWGPGENKTVRLSHVYSWNPVPNDKPSGRSETN